tara:strand:- start:2218 stop:2919 length:702 start_codon:yes stop_codon:yes gene_type:complete
MIHVIGAGGSGSASTNVGQIESGAAGGYCRKNSLAVTTSGSFTVVVGAGGASVIGAAGAGTAGGNSTVAGTGVGSTLTATGGAGGALAANTYTTGGTASNGDVNYAGGRGGALKGGGAVGLTGTGIDGGNAGSLYSSFGGRCDILGDFYSSSLGQLSGSSGGKGVYSTYRSYAGDEAVGPLAGGGGMGIMNTIGSAAGHASIGGGGGLCHGNVTTVLISGRGGEGCVVIQYIL